MTKNEGRTPTKTYFSGDELLLVKMAAVSQGLTASEFARLATLKAAAQAMADFTPPTLGESPSTSRKKKA
jgi:hypothetical protein